MKLKLTSEQLKEIQCEIYKLKYKEKRLRIKQKTSNVSGWDFIQIEIDLENLNKALKDKLVTL